VHQDCGRVLFAIKHDINCMVEPKLSLDDKKNCLPGNELFFTPIITMLNLYQIVYLQQYTDALFSSSSIFVTL
jgi:hypothetical protein